MKSEKHQPKQAGRTKSASANISRKTAPKSKTAPGARMDIPPLLLEGDETPTPAPSGPGQRYELGAAALDMKFVTGELPESYGTKRLFLTARDPHWLYAHWDLTREQIREYNSLSRDRHLILRVYLNEISGRPLSDVHVHPESRNWFVHVGKGGAKYQAEIGYLSKKGEWVSISTSQQTMTPPDTLSEDVSASFGTIPVDVPFDRLMSAVKSALKENLPLAEAVQKLRPKMAGLPDSKALASARWTPEQERAMAELISMDSVRRVWIGSLEITELLRRQMHEELSSAALAQFGLPSSAGLQMPGILPFSAGISSISSLFGAEQKRRKGFWFNVNAELIIYGATEPDASVSIGGRRIKLRPDGTFSYRFSLPDGQYELPAVAISADGTDGRAAELRFSRDTTYRGEVGAHPQDSALKPPLAANVA